MSKTKSSAPLCIFIGLIVLTGFIGCKVDSSSGGFAKKNLNTIKLTYSSSTISAAAGFADTEGTSPTWSLSSTVGITYSIAASTTSTTEVPTTDGSGSTINIDQTSGKVTITDAAVEGNSGKYTVTATAGSTSPVYTDGTTQTADITVKVYGAG